MEEAEVVSIICEYLQEKNYSFWIDDHPIHNNLNFQKYRLIIGSSRPDIFGINPTQQTFAIEVKGLRDYEKSIGQALIYKTGVNLAYIGGLEFKLNRIKNIALGSGLGLFYVDEKNQVVKEVMEPLYNFAPIYQDDVQNELKILKYQKNFNRSFASFGRMHILNYFMPIFLFNEKRPFSKSELISQMENHDWKNKTYSEFVNGANTIGLINFQENQYFLSELGLLCKFFFNLLDIKSLDNLSNLIDETGGRNNSVYKKYPKIAKFLQLIYYQNDDFKKFIEILYSYEKRKISLKEIINKLIQQYPNLFINLFIKKNKIQEVYEDYFLKGKQDTLLTDYNRLLSDFIYYNSFFSFKRHLVHLGILSIESRCHYKKTEKLDVEDDWWIIDRASLFK